MTARSWAVALMGLMVFQAAFAGAMSLCCLQPAADHAAMGHGSMDHAAMAHAPMNFHEGMDHGVDHSIDHSAAADSSTADHCERCAACGLASAAALLPPNGAAGALFAAPAPVQAPMAVASADPTPTTKPPQHG